MLINLRNALTAGKLTPQYTGVELVGSSVQLNNGILSGFAANQYAKLPFAFGSMPEPWEFVGVATVTTNSNAAIYGGVGTLNGCTPVYIGESGGNRFVATYLTGLGWPATWQPSGNVYGDRYQYNVQKAIKVTFSGNRYEMSNADGGSWEAVSYINSSNIGNGRNLVMQMGTNRGGESFLHGTIDLNYCYVAYGGKLLWEGVAGAYTRVKSLYGAGILG